MRKRSGQLRTFLEWLDSGEKTSGELMDICLGRIRELDSGLKVWVEVAPQPPLTGGPLSGIPFGAKDIFETLGLSTEFGSPIYAGRKGETDAALVTDLRRRGALLVGKTHTTAFAYFDPAPTRNPRDPRHTPGGSSSGSAAAVAAGMVPFALGTQTQGSVLRPASYCGIVGFKPTRCVLPMDGVLPFAPSLDTAGLFTQTADDMKLLWDRLGFSLSAGGCARFGVPARSFDVDTEMQQAFVATLARLPIEPIELPTDFARAAEAVRQVCEYEGARTHRKLWERHGARIGGKLAGLVQRGLEMPEPGYRSALETLERLKSEMEILFRRHAVILTPAAPGPAPAGLSSTGDPRMNSPWTGLETPAVSIPMPVSGLPLGLQMAAAPGADGLLLNAAAEVESLLD